jgi:hypothetical protein
MTCLTIFRSLAINYLQTSLENDVGLAFIYFNYKEQQTLSDVLGSLLQQLLRRAQRMTHGVCALYERCTGNDSKRRPTSSELSILLQSESQFFSKLFIVIDALDECPSVDDMTSKFLLELQKLRPSPQVLVTSRPHLKSIIKQFLPNTICLEIRAHDEDIKKYLNEQFKRKHVLTLLVTDTTEIIEKIIEKAQGMSVPPCLILSIYLT